MWETYLALVIYQQISANSDVRLLKVMLSKGCGFKKCFTFHQSLTQKCYQSCWSQWLLVRKWFASKGFKRCEYFIERKATQLLYIAFLHSTPTACGYSIKMLTRWLLLTMDVDKYSCHMAIIGWYPPKKPFFEFEINSSHSSHSLAPKKVFCG